MTKTLFLTVLLTSGVCAQNDAPTFVEARLAETEQDLPRAATLYAKLAESAEQPAERSRAWLALADLRAKLGEFEAAKAALGKAAQGEGPAAQQAKQRQAGSRDATAQVYELIGKLRNGVDVKGQLIWIGRPAVAPLIEWIGRDQLNVEFLTSAVEVLRRIGGVEVEAFLARVAARTGEPLVQRAVLRGMGDEGAEPLLKAMRGFATVDDPRVLQDALLFPDIFTKARVLDLLSHEDADLRRVAYSRLKSWETLRGPDDVAVRRRALERVRPLVEEFGNFNNSLSIFARADSTENRELYLDGLAMGIELQLRWPKNSSRIGVDEHAARVVEVARVLGAVEGAANGPQRRLTNFAVQCMTHWTRDSLDQVIALLELGYFQSSSSDAEIYIDRTARSTDLPRVFKSLSKFAELKWVANLEAAATVAEFEPLRAEFVRIAEASPRGNVRDDHAALVERIVKIEDPTAIRWLGEYLSGDYWNTPVVRTQVVNPGLTLEWVAKVLVREGNLHPRNIRALRAIATCAQESDKVLSARFVARYGLLILGDVDSATITAKIYAEQPELAQHDELIARVVSDLRRKETLPSAPVARLLDECLATGNPLVWQHVLETDGVTLSFGKSPEVRAALLRHLDSAPRKRLAVILPRLCTDAAAPGSAEAIRRYLDDSDPRVRRVATERLVRFFEFTEILRLAQPRLADSDVAVVCAAIPQVAMTKLPAAVELLKPLLGHESSQVRQTLLANIGQHHHDSAIEFALRLGDDEESFDVRSEICAIANRSLDQRFVPILVEYLRGGLRLRQTARPILDEIRYYHDEKSRWDRIRSGTDLGTTSAAEALVAQTKQTEARAVRLVAIQSLGTLGVAETLPVLIELMRDRDAEVAAAAKAAITKINSQPARMPAKK